MKGTDKTILIVLPLVALLGAFWFLFLAPKRQEASKLETDVASLQADVDEQQQVADAAEAARETFPADYRRVVVLGKAVPANADTPSLLVQLNRLAGDTSVDFQSLGLVTSGGATPAAPPPPAPATDATAAQETESQVANVESGAASVTPTEGSVATQPIGATTGPAGLPIMPYDMTFAGRYFDVVDFIGKLDDQVGLRTDGVPSVFGRLVTIDGFSLTLPDSGGSTAPGSIDLADPTLKAEFAVTTFVTPEDQGVTAGASPTGPAPVGPQPVSSTTTDAVPAPPAAAVSAGGTP